MRGDQAGTTAIRNSSREAACATQHQPFQQQTAGTNLITFTDLNGGWSYADKAQSGEARHQTFTAEDRGSK